MPGPQTEAYYCEADELFYGGAAGGGKTDLLLGTALLFRRVVIFRRVFPSLRAIIDRSRMLYNRAGVATPLDSFNEGLYRWKFADGRSIRFGSIQYEKDVLDWQGQPHDFYGFDELPEFTQYQYTYVTGWLRHLDLRQGTKRRKPRIICTGNPPTTTEGRWVIDYWAPWIQKPVQCAPGELRWYTTIDGKEVEFPDGTPIEHRGEIIVPRSRTFIPASIEDNPYLLEAGYKARLQALPEPLRSKLLSGDFTAGVKDDPWQLIPTAWLEQAQERWKRLGADYPIKKRMRLEQMGVDVSRGGRDRTVLTPRYEWFFGEQIVEQGTVTDDGPKVAGIILRHVKPDTVVCVDVIGVGSSAYDAVKPYAKTFPFDATKKSTGKDKRSGVLGFYNLKSEAAWRLREALDPDTGDNLAIPPDKKLTRELTSFHWELTTRGIKVESKEDIVDRLGFSPDLAESLFYAHAQPSAPGQGMLDFYAAEHRDLKRQQHDERTYHGR